MEPVDEGGRTSGPRLKPAIPDIDGKQPYMPRIPWKWIVLVAIAIGIVASVLFYLGRKADVKTRSQIVATIDGPLAKPSSAYQAFRAKLENWVIASSKGGKPKTYVDERLRFSELHKGKGLYLRLREEDATSSDAIAKAIGSFQIDAIPRCLGVAPTSLRTFYQQGDFLLPAWQTDAKNETQSSRLDVLKMDLELRAKRDLPNVLELLKSDYFLLAIQRGQSREDEPVDVFLWNLKTDKLLLSMRTQASGRLVPVRLPGSTGPSTSVVLDSPAAHDCSIAAALKEAAGEPALQFGAQLETTDTGSATPTGDAGVTRPTSDEPANEP